MSWPLQELIVVPAALWVRLTFQPKAAGVNPTQNLLPCSIGKWLRLWEKTLCKSPLIPMMNTQTEINPYGAERTGPACQLLPGSLPVPPQAGSGRQSATGITSTNEKRRGWTRANNINAMECYYRSQPEKRGYMKRMHQIWKDRGLFSTTDQRIADQVRVIKRSGLMSDLEMEEIRQRVTTTRPNAEIQTTVNEHVEPVEEIVENEITVEIIETPIVRPRPSEEQREIINSLKNIIEGLEQKREMPKLKKIPKDKIRKETGIINQAIGYIDTADIGGTNDLIFAGARLVLERLQKGQKTGGRKTQVPAWKMRLERKLEDTRKDLAKMNNIKEGRQFITSEMERRYWLKKKGIDRVIEELKQRVTSTAAKIKRYSDRVNQFHANHLFEIDQKRFYQSLEGKQQEQKPPPEPDAALEFWSNIWSRPHTHKEDAKWIKEAENDHKDIEKQTDMEIKVVGLKRILGRLSPWKAAGPDGVQGYWVKNFTALHTRIVNQMNEMIKRGNPPTWMTTGRTVLIPKDSSKGNIPSNYRPITCLPIMYKVLTAIQRMMCVPELCYCCIDTSADQLCYVCLHRCLSQAITRDVYMHVACTHSLQSVHMPECCLGAYHSTRGRRSTSLNN